MYISDNNLEITSSFCSLDLGNEIWIGKSFIDIYRFSLQKPPSRFFIFATRKLWNYLVQVFLVGFSSFLLSGYTSLVHYRVYKTFNFESFKTGLENALRCYSANYDDFNQIFTFTLHHYTIMYKNWKSWIRGNHRPHMNNTMRKAIMLRSKLKHRANKSKHKGYKNIRKDSKPFRNACKPYFTNKNSRDHTSIMLV